VDQVYCEGDEASLEPFVIRFDHLRKTGNLSLSQFTAASASIDDLVNTKKMIDKIRNQMLSQGFHPRFSGWDVTMKPPSIHDFEILKPISKGAYGRVFLAQKKTTKDVYAIKVLKREEMLTSQQRDNILLEVLGAFSNNSFFNEFLNPHSVTFWDASITRLS
jgi:serine/threonine protein kinase